MWPFTKRIPEIRGLVHQIVDLCGDYENWYVEKELYSWKKTTINIGLHDRDFKIFYTRTTQVSPHGIDRSTKINFVPSQNFVLNNDERDAIIDQLDKLISTHRFIENEKKFKECSRILNEEKGN